MRVEEYWGSKLKQAIDEDKPRTFIKRSFFNTVCNNTIN